MEEDFLAWKEPMWSAVAEKMGLEEREAVYEPIFGITERENLSKDSAEVYLGEPNKMHLEGSSKGPYNAHNPYIAPIAESSELFSLSRIATVCTWRSTSALPISPIRPAIMSPCGLPTPAPRLTASSTSWVLPRNATMSSASRHWSLLPRSLPDADNL